MKLIQLSFDRHLSAHCAIDITGNSSRLATAARVPELSANIALSGPVEKIRKYVMENIVYALCTSYGVFRPGLSYTLRVTPKILFNVMPAEYIQTKYLTLSHPKGV